MQTTENTRAFIEAQQYSQFILRVLHDGLLPETFWRNVSDFQHGETLNIKTIGTATLQEVSEDSPIIYEPISTGNVTLKVTEEEGDAWYITDNLREDGNQTPALMAARASESTRAFQESFETKFLKACNDAQIPADPNLINGFAHRIASTETNNVFALKQLIDMRLAFQKANVPDSGWVFICDPVVEATLNSLVNITTDVTQFAADILEQGMSSGMRYLRDYYGFMIIVSNRLDKNASMSDGTTVVTDAVANVAMCILDDQCKPIMGVIRRVPSVEGERNKDLRRDEWAVSSRYGFGPQRVDTLGIIITSSVNS